MNREAIPPDDVSVNMSKLAVELSGYIDAGMKDEALELAGAILDSERISPSEFRGAIRAIGVFSDRIDDWTARVEPAYRRQSAKFRDKVRETMVHFYSSIQDWKKASRFIRLRTLNEPADLLFAMHVLLELDQLAKAKRILRECHRFPYELMSIFDQHCLIETSAMYFARIGEWENAIHVWRFAPIHESLARDALVRIVELYAAHALWEARRGLFAIGEMRKEFDPEMEIISPGNNDSITDDAEKSLLRLKGALEDILPEKRQKELGMSAADEADAI